MTYENSELNNWIDAKLNPPKKDGRYLVVEDHLYNWVGVCSLRNGKWDSSTITYYQDLPEPPR